MCCFTQSVESVANTRIFSRLSGTGTQFLVYQMEFKSRAPNAMILPLPIALPATEESVRFINLKEYPEIFRDLDRGFPTVAPPSGWLETRSKSVAAAPDILKVHDVGDFVASFVPSVNDFGRLDPQFVIPKESWEKIPGYHDYGFAVFQLKSLEGSIQPIALEFPTRFPEEAFFPTVHIHDGEVHQREHFDHLLYLQNAQWDGIVDAYQGPSAADRNTKFVRSKQVASHYSPSGKSSGIVDAQLLIHRKRMRGVLENRDVVVRFKPAIGKTTSSIFNGSLLGATTLAASLSWFFSRRNKLLGQKINKSSSQ